LLIKVSDWPPDPHHFLSFTIGLAAWLTVLEGLHLASHRPVYRRVFEFWLKVFIAFGFGVVSGIVMAFQFGMNWSELSRISGPIQGPLFAVALYLRDSPNLEYWEDGRRASVRDGRAGESCFYDLKREPRGLLDKPYHTLIFDLPRAALNAIADEQDENPLE
jgi:hypothetical protein